MTANTGKYEKNILTENCGKAVVRKLTPKRMFLDCKVFQIVILKKQRELNSDTQLYKQAGNSVTVNVIYEIAKIKKRGDFM